jgi:GTP diphosphokinase / guanosine-3',5'-bis(diphosphate) 3'-diphosphatase
MHQMLNAMISKAAEHFDGMFDKAGMPYILHCLAVLNIAIQRYGDQDEELLCIAVGHDLFEDTNCTAHELMLAGISSRVIVGIDAMTKHDGQSYENYKHRVFINNDSLRIKPCDLTHNMDPNRMKNTSEKDLNRLCAYTVFYKECKELIKLKEL